MNGRLLRKHGDTSCAVEITKRPAEASHECKIRNDGGIQASALTGAYTMVAQPNWPSTRLDAIELN